MQRFRNPLFGLNQKSQICEVNSGQNLNSGQILDSSQSNEILSKKL